MFSVKLDMQTESEVQTIPLHELGFGMMRLPIKNGVATDFDYAKLYEMVDLCILQAVLIMEPLIKRGFRWQVCKFTTIWENVRDSKELYALAISDFASYFVKKGALPLCHAS